MIVTQIRTPPRISAENYPEVMKLGRRITVGFDRRPALPRNSVLFFFI